MSRIEILVVGGGPAGLTAGIYGARSGHRTTIIERQFSGGQMALTSEIENYPGLADPINGMELAQTMEKQALRFGCSIVNGEATGIQATGTGFEVASNAGTLDAETVIIVTGAVPRSLGVPGEKELVGRGVSYCAVCDGPFFKNREVAVLGGGDSALDEALYLANIVRRVHVIHRRDEFRGCRLAQERLRKRANVELHLSHTVTSINGTSHLENLTLRSMMSGEISTLAVDAIFIYIGWLPNTGWCSRFVRLDEGGSIITDERMRTSVPGVFAAGDVRNTPLRQVATAVGDGALAAMQAHEFLAARE